MTSTTSRYEGDTWDLASSVGVTATMVAAARAMATRSRQTADQRPVRRAAGARSGGRPARPAGQRGIGPKRIERRARRSGRRFCIRGVRRGHVPDDRQHGRPHQVLRRVLPRRDQGRHQAGRHPGVRAGLARVPADLARRAPRLRDRPTAGHRIQDPERWPSWAPRPPPTGAWSPSTCATTGRPRCAPPDSTPSSRPRGAPRVCWATCRPEAQDRLLDTITELSAPGSRIATESAPQLEPGDEDRMRERMQRSPSAGVPTGSTST